MTKKELYKHLTSPIGLLVFGFFLTTVCGALINELHTRSSSNRDKQFELLKGKLAKHEELLSSLSKVMGARVFRLQRVLWALDAPSSEPGGETWQLDADTKTRLDTVWGEYYTTVTEWNLTYRDYTTRIRLFAGDQVANKFFVAGASGAKKARSDSVCGTFEACHTMVKELRDMARKSATVNGAKHDLAQVEIDALYEKVDGFMADLYHALDEREKSDNPLEPRGSRN